MKTAILAVALGTVGLALVLPSSAQDADALKAGKRIYSDAGCHNCHGDRGQGGGGVDFPAGPSLRASQLDPEGMIQIISCGIPGTRMPAWLKGAYTETACFGEPVGPPPSGTIVTGILSPDEINTLVGYIQSTFMGRTTTSPQ